MRYGSVCFFFFSSRRRHTRCGRDWSSDVCSSDLLLLSVCVAALPAAAAAAQGSDSLSVARRIVAATSLAAKEYATGVPARGGRGLAPAEVDEAKQFLDGARADVGGLPAAVRAATDSGLVALRALIERVAPPHSVAQRAAPLGQRIAAAAGGALDPFPLRPPAPARGAAVYTEQCVQCHGATGLGDRPKARHLEGPPPPRLADR